MFIFNYTEKLACVFSKCGLFFSNRFHILASEPGKQSRNLAGLCSHLHIRNKPTEEKYND